MRLLHLRSDRPARTSRPPLLLTLVAVLAVATVGMPTAATAKIVVGQGIQGVKIGDTQARVTKLLGKPAERLRATKLYGPVWSYPKKPFQGRISFDRKTRRVIGMWTGSKKQKTSKRIGAGSSLSKTKKAYPGAECGPGPFGGTSVICRVQSRFKGKQVFTSFVFYAETLGMREVNVDVAS